MTLRSTLDWLVSYADTDAGGIVYHARYIEQAERSRHRLLLDIDFPFSKLENENNCLLVVRAIDASYERPAFLGQNLQVSSMIRQLREAYSVWETKVECDSVCHCSIVAKIVCLSARERNLCTMPENLFQRLLIHAL